jgi:hypothetical protein
MKTRINRIPIKVTIYSNEDYFEVRMEKDSAVKEDGFSPREYEDLRGIINDKGYSTMPTPAVQHVGYGYRIEAIHFNIPIDMAKELVFNKLF